MEDAFKKQEKQIFQLSLPVFFSLVAAVLFSILLTSTTFFLGAVPLMRARKVSHQNWFVYLGVVFISALVLSFFHLYALTLFLITFFIMIEVFERDQNKEGQQTLFKRSLKAILGSSFFFISALSLSYFLKTESLNRFLADRRLVIEKQSFLKLTFEEYLQQSFGFFIVFLILTLIFTLFFNYKKKEEREEPLSQYKSREQSFLFFSVPSWVVWLGMLTLLLVYLDHGQGWLRVIGNNLFTILLFTFFVQGYSILLFFFKLINGEIKRSRIIFLFLIGLICFLFFVFIGFIDFWVDFRLRLERYFLNKNKVN